MSKRIQVILDEEEVRAFKAQARKESKSLSSWLKDAGNLAIEARRNKSALRSVKALKEFFQECKKKEEGTEPDWEDHKKLIQEGYHGEIPS